MFFILGWILFGIIVAWISRNIVGVQSVGTLNDIFIAVCGSFMGGAINYLMGNGTSIFQTSGIFMSIIGSCLFLVLFSEKQENKDKNNDN